VRKKIFARLKTTQQKKALERINTLFAEAEKAFAKHPERSHRYVTLAYKLATRYKTKIPKKYKRRFCKHCKSFLMPGKNCIIRVREKRVVYRCLECGGIMRYMYAKEKKAKTKAKKTKKGAKKK
jgi:ribonuclease P protein subunit RPR2